MPLRKVFEGVGKKVDWNNEDKSVSISDYYHAKLLMKEQESTVYILMNEFWRLSNPVQVIRRANRK